MADEQEKNLSDNEASATEQNATQNTVNNQEKQGKKLDTFHKVLLIIGAILGIVFTTLQIINITHQIKAAKETSVSSDSSAKTATSTAAAVPATTINSNLKVEKVVEGIIEKYYDDFKIFVINLDHGEKTLEIHIYAFNDNTVNPEKAIKMAEEVYDLIQGEKTELAGIEYVYHSATAKLKVDEERELNMPLVIWFFMKMPDKQMNEFWVSKIYLLNREVFENYDIFEYEYTRSKIFKAISLDNFDIDDQTFSEYVERIFGHNGYQ